MSNYDSFAMVFFTLQAPPFLLKVGDGQAPVHSWPAVTCRGGSLGVGDANSEGVHTDSSENAVAGINEHRRWVDLHDVLHP